MGRNFRVTASNAVVQGSCLHYFEVIRLLVTVKLSLLVYCSGARGSKMPDS